MESLTFLCSRYFTWLFLCTVYLLHKDRDTCLFDSLSCPKHLDQHRAHRKCWTCTGLNWTISANSQLLSLCGQIVICTELTIVLSKELYQRSSKLLPQFSEHQNWEFLSPTTESRVPSHSHGAVWADSPSLLQECHFWERVINFSARGGRRKEAPWLKYFRKFFIKQN